MPASQRLPVPSRYQTTRSQALQLFAERGFSRVSMRELADYLGIRPGSLYHHIESKEALLFELVEELYEELLHGAQLIKRRLGSPAEHLHGMLEAHLRLHASMGEHFRLAEYDGHCLGEEQQARIGALRERYERLLADCVERVTGQALGNSRRAALSGVVSLLNQLPAWVQTPRLSPQAHLDLLGDMAMSALQGALRAPLD
ncbi:TetR/AcrR family transcriptional regulator [Pseudomonas zhanjiangensis]|uniref:TetR/AcrR family transcriptional regulator n=1 Tax=Pseudomonas zhanjiangensis TaxID=3239015 RepID=A0ABV3YY60_9PSED